MKSTEFYAWNPLNQIIEENFHFHRVHAEPVSYEICEISIQQEYTKSNMVSQEFLKSTRFNTIS